MVIDGAPEVVFYLQKFHGASVHSRLEHLVSGFAVLLGAVHRRVGVTHTIFRSVIAKSAEGDANACGGKHFVPAEVERQC